MKALFLTTQTVDCQNHVRAWDSFAPRPAVHTTFNPSGIRNDWQLVETARRVRPDVIFYIGACKAPANPRIDTFRALREIAPTINMVSDAADRPWHPVLVWYRAEECFDLQVAIDGARDAPVDLATLTPVDPRPFAGRAPRTIRCGFSGGFRRRDYRGGILAPLEDEGLLVVRRRVMSYEDHAEFLMHCELVINTPFTGSGHAMHVKGRVVEAGWAGCGLLEMVGSPAWAWLPQEGILTYQDADHARRLIEGLSEREIERAACALSARVCDYYTPAKIYGAMLERIGLDVGTAVKRATA